MARSIRRKGPFARLFTTLLLLAVVASFTGIGSAIPAVADGDTPASQEATTSPPPVEESVEPAEEAPAPEVEEPAADEAPATPAADGEPTGTVSPAVATVTDRPAPPALSSVPPVASAIAWDYVPASRVTMEGYSRYFGAWVHSNLKKGYVEGEWIPFRLKIENTTDATQSVPAAEYWVDFKQALSANSAIAIDDTTGWSYYVAPSLPPSADLPVGAHAVTPDFEDQPRDGEKGLVTKIPEVSQFLIPPHSSGAVYFRAHLAITQYWQTKPTPFRGASYFTGSSAQARLWEWYSGGNIGNKTVPFPVGRAVAPDSLLQVTKYNDLDGDGDTNDPDPKLTSPAFTFKLKYLDPAFPFTLVATTVNGIANFAKLPPGDYELSEVANGDWVSTNLPQTITVPRSTAVKFSALNFTPRVQLEIEKRADRDEAAPGDVINYTLRYRNAGNTTAHNVSIVDDFDEALVTPTGYAPASLVGGMLVWNIGDLAPGTAWHEITYAVTVVDTLPSEAEVVRNRADILLGQVSKDYAEERVRVAAAPDLHVTKVASTDVAAPGDVVFYTIEYWNDGSTAAHDVALVDDFVDGDSLLYTVLDAGGGIPGPGDVLFWPIGEVAADGVHHTVTVVITVAGILPGFSNDIDNVARLYMGQQVADEAAEHVDVYASAELSIDKSVIDAPADAGDEVTYRVDFFNNGTTAASNVMVTDSYDTAYVGSVVDADGGDASMPGLIVWNVGSVAAKTGGSFVYTVKLRDVMPAAHNDVFNTAAIFENQGWVDDDTEMVSVDAAPDWSFDKVAVPSETVPGGAITYTLYYTNSGSLDAPDVAIVDDFDESLVQVVDAGGGIVFDGGSKIFFALGTVPADGVTRSVSYTVNVFDYMPKLSNHVDNLADLYMSGQIVAHDTDSVYVPAETALAVDKTADRTEAEPGDLVTYTVAWSNTGGSTSAHNVWIADNYDQILAEVVSTDGGTDNGDVIYWYLGDVAPDETGSFTYQVKVKDVMPSTHNNVHNTAAIYEGDGLADWAEWDVYVEAYAEMTYMKTADKTVAASGDEVEYTVSYRNDGQAPARGVFIVDDFADVDAGLYSIVGVDGGGVVSGDEITWDVGDVAPDGVTHELHVTIETTKPMPALENDIYNIAYFYEDYPYLPQDQVADLIPEFEKRLVDTHDWNVDVPEMDLSIAKASDVPMATALDVITYTVTYKNESSVPAKDFTVTDDYDETLVDVVDAAGAVDNGDTLVWTVGTELAVGASGSFTYKTQVKGPEVIPADVITPLVNTATILHPDDWDETNNIAEATVLVSNPTAPFTPPDLTIEKSADKTEAAPGDTVTYILTFKNVGEGPSQGFEIVDDYDERYATVVDAGGGTVAGGQITWEKDYLAAGASGKVTYIVEIDENMPDGKTNVDNVVVIKDSTDRNPDNDRDTWRVVVGEPFLPFTGGDATWLLGMALFAAAAGAALRKRGARG